MHAPAYISTYFFCNYCRSGTLWTGRTTCGRRSGRPIKTNGCIVTLVKIHVIIRYSYVYVGNAGSGGFE